MMVALNWTARLTAISMVMVLSLPLVAAAQDEEDPVGPPGSTLAWGGAIVIEPVDEADPDATATGPIFAYERAFLFARDEDWCRHAALQLDIEITDGWVAGCLDWVAVSPFGVATDTGFERVLLPEMWAIRIAKRVGWYPEDE